MHANATLTPLMRAKMIRHLTNHHLSLRATADAFRVCEKTVRKWLRRANEEGFKVATADPSRLAFACLLPDEKIPSALAALHQAVCFYSAHGIKIQRPLTDRGPTYRSRLFASTCQKLGIKHLFTKPYRPQTN